jgi:hypothetical protein
MMPPGTDRRTGVSTILLGLGVVWLLLMACLLYRAEPGWPIIPVFLFIAAILCLIALASIRTGEWDRFGQLALWTIFGLTLPVWMIGIFSIGWLFFPVLLLELAALIAWPRPKGTSIITKTGLVFEVVGFLTIPIVVLPLILWTV